MAILYGTIFTLTSPSIIKIFIISPYILINHIPSRSLTMLIPRNKTEEQVEKERTEALENRRQEMLRREEFYQADLIRQREKIAERIIEAKEMDAKFCSIVGEIYPVLESELKDKGYYVYSKPATTLPGNAVTYIEFEKDSSKPRIHVDGLGPFILSHALL